VATEETRPTKRVLIVDDEPTTIGLFEVFSESLPRSIARAPSRAGRG